MKRKAMAIFFRKTTVPVTPTWDNLCYTKPEKIIGLVGALHWMVHVVHETGAKYPTIIDQQENIPQHDAHH